MNCYSCGFAVRRSYSMTIELEETSIDDLNRSIV